jgi:phosphatidylglycerophosphate synthase
MITKEKFYYLYNKNSPKNSKRKAGPIDAKIVLRDLSLPIAYFLAKKRVSANLVSVVFLLLGVTANSFIVIPGIFSLIISLFLHEITQLIDCVDGQLARYYGSAFKEGEKFDTLITILITGTFMIGFGARLYFQTNNPIFLFLGGLGAFLKAFEHQLIVEKSTLLDLGFAQKLRSKSNFFRFVTYGIESIITEVRLFCAVLLILNIANMFFNAINFEQVAFSILIVFAFAENLLLRIYLAYTSLSRAKKRAWEGWI